jgi:hypothetical protein
MREMKTYKTLTEKILPVKEQLKDLGIEGRVLLN